MIDSPVELILIRETQKVFDDDNSYWIGGSTTATENATVTYFDYYNNSTGKENNTFIHFNCKKLSHIVVVHPLIIYM